MNPGLKAPMILSTLDSYLVSYGHSWDRESGNLGMNQCLKDGFLPRPLQSMWELTYPGTLHCVRYTN